MLAISFRHSNGMPFLFRFGIHIITMTKAYKQELCVNKQSGSKNQEWFAELYDQQNKEIWIIILRQNEKKEEKETISTVSILCTLYNVVKASINVTSLRASFVITETIICQQLPHIIC